MNAMVRAGEVAVGPIDPLQGRAGADQGLIPFRPAALQHMRRPEQVGRAMQLVRSPYLPTLWLTGAVMVACLAASAVVKVPLMIVSPGMVLQAGQTLESTISAQHEGLLSAITVAVGDRVEVGDVVATVAQPTIENDLRLAREENAAAVERLDHVRSLQASSLSTLEPLHTLLAGETADSIARLNRRQADLTQLLASNEQLRDKGLITIDRFLQIRSQLGDALDAISSKKASLITLQVERIEKQNHFAREVSDLGEKIAHTRRQIGRLEGQLRLASAVTATQAGRVSEIKLAAGDLVRFNSAVIGVIPDGNPAMRPGSNPLIAVALVPVIEGKKVNAGDEAFVDPASVRRDLYGQIRARVTSVSETPATPERLRNLLRNDDLVRKMGEGGPSFLATVELEASPSTLSGYAWTSSRGPDGKLTGGTPARVEIVTERTPLLGLLVPALKQMLRMGAHY